MAERVALATASIGAVWSSCAPEFGVRAVVDRWSQLEPTVLFAILALRLREPVRGKWEREAMGANEDVANTEEVVPSFAGKGILWLEKPFELEALLTMLEKLGRKLPGNEPKGK